MKLIHYLAYGSNLHPYRLSDRLDRVGRVGNVSLPDWKLCFHKRGADGSGKGNLIRSQGEQAYAVLYALNMEQKHILDGFEGDGYDCIDMTVTVGQKQVDCFCYLAQPDWVDDQLLPHDWYHELVLLGAQHAGFPEGYLLAIKQQTVQSDFDGRQQHEWLLQRMQKLSS